MSPTCVQILEDPNLLGINQNTCSESTRCQPLTLCSAGFLAAGIFVSPLESSVSFEITLTIVPEIDLSMQMRQTEKQSERGKAGRCIIMAQIRYLSLVPVGRCEQAKQKKAGFGLTMSQ